MRTCKKCLAKNEREYQFCAVCSEPLPREDEIIITQKPCPYCYDAITVDPTVTRCDACGHNVCRCLLCDSLYKTDVTYCATDGSRLETPPASWPLIGGSAARTFMTEEAILLPDQRNDRLGIVRRGNRRLTPEEFGAAPDTTWGAPLLGRGYLVSVDSKSYLHILDSNGLFALCKSVMVARGYDVNTHSLALDEDTIFLGSNKGWISRYRFKREEGLTLLTGQVSCAGYVLAPLALDATHLFYAGVSQKNPEYGFLGCTAKVWAEPESLRPEYDALNGAPAAAAPQPAPVTGKALWECEELDGPVVAPLILAEESVIALTQAGTVYAYDMQGSQRWKYASGATALGGIALGEEEGALYFGNQDGLLYAIDLPTGKARWDCKVSRGLAAGPTLSPQEIFLPDMEGTLHVLTRRNGNRRATLKARGVIEVPAIVSGQDLFVPDRDGWLYWARLDALTDLIAIGQIERDISFPLAVGEGALYAVHREYMVALEPFDGSRDGQ